MMISRLRQKFLVLGLHFIAFSLPALAWTLGTGTPKASSGFTVNTASRMDVPDPGRFSYFNLSCNSRRVRQHFVADAFAFYMIGANEFIAEPVKGQDMYRVSR